MNALISSEELGWEEQAACRTEDPAIFASPELEEEAKSICNTCEVREECLAMALDDTTLDVNVLGGMNSEERQELSARLDVVTRALAKQGMGTSKEWQATPPSEKLTKVMDMVREYGALVDTPGIEWGHMIQTTQRRYASFLDLYLTTTDEDEIKEFFNANKIYRSTRAGAESYAIRCIGGYVRLRKRVEMETSIVEEEPIPEGFASLRDTVLNLYEGGRLDNATAQQLMLFLGYAQPRSDIRPEVVEVARQQAAAKLRERLSRTDSDALGSDVRLRRGAMYLSGLVGSNIREVKSLTSLANSVLVDTTQFSSHESAKAYVERYVSFLLNHLYPPRVE